MKVGRDPTRKITKIKERNKILRVQTVKKFAFFNITTIANNWMEYCLKYILHIVWI